MNMDQQLDVSFIFKLYNCSFLLPTSILFRRLIPSRSLFIIYLIPDIFSYASLLWILLEDAVYSLLAMFMAEILLPCINMGSDLGLTTFYCSQLPFFRREYMTLVNSFTQHKLATSSYSLSILVLSFITTRGAWLFDAMDIDDTTPLSLLLFLLLFLFSLWLCC